MAKSTRIKQLSPREFAELTGIRSGVNNGTYVTILVGPEEVKFELPRNILVRHSKYFERAFLGHFEEAETQILKLSEDSVESFELLIQYLYTGSINVCIPATTWREEDHMFKMRKNKQQDTPLTPFLKFCVLTDKLDIECTEAIVDNIWKKIAPNPLVVQPEDISYAWENLPIRHPAREMLAKATLSDYFDGIMEDNNKFTQEIEEVEGYAADLLRVYSSHVRAHRSNTLLFPNPRTGNARVYCLPLKTPSASVLD